MKRIVKRLLSGLALASLTQPALAVTTDGGGNPYQVVVERNAFDLKPIPPPPDPNIPPPAPPTKITLQGITVLFGKKQVLLKVPEPPEPGKPPKERALIMDEGERRGALEVVRIDPEAREVEFKDSGNTVKLKLADFVAKTPSGAGGAMPAPSIPIPGNPSVPRPAVPTLPQPAGISPAGPGGGVTTPSNMPQRPLRTTPLGMSLPTASPTVGSPGGVPTITAGVPTIATATPQPQPVQLTPEEQIIIMEVERERNKNNPNYPPLPPTPLTPPSSMPPTVPPMPEK